MKKSFLMLYCIIYCLVAGCKKEGNRQYSDWHIIGKGDFSSNKVHVESSATHVLFETEGQSLEGTAFTLVIYNVFDQTFPQKGDFILSGSPDKKNKIGFAFRYNGAYYELSNSTYQIITAQSYNGKAKYVLDTAWFFDYFKPNDSVQIYGTFLEP